MTNDILEQVTEDYLREKGYFTQHNISYRPGDFKQTPSDLDILAVNPLKDGVERVAVVSCKSWQNGLKIKSLLKDLTERPKIKVQGKSRENLFREIANPSWSNAMILEVFKRTGQKNFTFYISATHIIGNREDWQKFKLFADNLPNCDIKLIDLKEMIEEISKLKRETKMPLHSELSRMLQLIEAGKGKISWSDQ